MILDILFLCFLLASLIQIGYWLFFFSRLAFFQKRESFSQIKNDPVSIIICARNEEKNLKKNLPRILTQNYRSFEVIVVNDGSTDNTEKVVLDYQLIYPILCYVNLKNKPKNVLGKKYALSKGIELAQNETLLLTDADCSPKSSDWLRHMQSTIQGPVKIGLGYGPYTKTSGLLNLFIRFEAAYTAIQYLSFALSGLPYMGVGRNLIYQKSLFKKVGGFNSHLNIASGDDDLFINAVANDRNTAICLHKDSFVYSYPKTSWISYFRQKRRHHTTGKHYKMKHKIALGLLALSHFIHLTGGIVLVILNSSTMFVTLLYLVRMSIIMSLSSRILRKLDEQDLLVWVPFLDLAFLFYYLAFAPISLKGKTETWN